MGRFLPSLLALFFLYKYKTMESAKDTKIIARELPQNFHKKIIKIVKFETEFSAIIHPYQLLSRIPKIHRNFFHPFPSLATS